MLAHIPKVPRLAVFSCEMSRPGGSRLPPLRERLGEADEPLSHPPEGEQRQQALRDLRRASAAPTAPSRFLEASDSEGTARRPPQGSAAEHRGYTPMLRSFGWLVPCT